MAVELIDLMLSLYHVIEEENQILVAARHLNTLSELVSAKTRLVGQLDAEVARLQRETPDWMEQIDEAMRLQLSDAAGSLRNASIANARLLERQIEFSVDLMGAIAAEAQRVTGKRNAIYGAHGGMALTELPAPISINARL